MVPPPVSAKLRTSHSTDSCEPAANRCHGAVADSCCSVSTLEAPVDKTSASGLASLCPQTSEIVSHGPHALTASVSAPPAAVGAVRDDSGEQETSAQRPPMNLLQLATQSLVSMSNTTASDASPAQQQRRPRAMRVHERTTSQAGALPEPAPASTAADAGQLPRRSAVEAHSVTGRSTEAVTGGSNDHHAHRPAPAGVSGACPRRRSQNAACT